MSATQRSSSCVRAGFCRFSAPIVEAVASPVEPAEQKEPKPWVGQDLGVLGKLVGETVRRGELVVDQVVGVVGAEQVGAAGGAEEQRAAGEHPHRLELAARRCGREPRGRRTGG